MKLLLRVIRWLLSLSPEDRGLLLFVIFIVAFRVGALILWWNQ